MIVYLARNNVNGKGYVGCTTLTLEYRKREHISDSRNDSHLWFHQALRKHGLEAFEWSILETLNEGSTVADLEIAEKKWVAELRTFSERGYNMTPGGRLGGAALKGRIVRIETRQRISQARLGTRLSDDHRASIKNGVRAYYDKNQGPNVGKRWSNDSRMLHAALRHFKKKPVFGYDGDGTCIVAYLSLDDAVEATGLSYRTLAGNRKKYRPKFVNGITYRRSALSIESLKKIMESNTYGIS